MTDYPNIVEELAEEVIEATEHRDDLEPNIATFITSLEEQIREKVQEIAADRFCPECGAKMQTEMNDDGTNLEEVLECSNPDCPDTD